MISRILLFLAFLNIVFSASIEENIKDIIEKQTDAKINVVSVNELKDNKEFKLVVIEIADGTSQRIPIFTNKDGTIIVGLSNIFFTSSVDDEGIVKKITDEAAEYSDKYQKEEAGKLIKALKPEQYITLKSKAKNPGTYFIVSDPNCAYCREELRNVEDKLKTHNVNMVMVGILGEDSKKKAAYLIEKVKSNMSEKDKLNGIREVFSSNFEVPNDVNVGAVSETTDFLFKTGVIRGVPFIYELQ